MIYLGSNEILGIKLGNTDISAIYAGDLLIYPTSVAGWSVEPSTIEMAASGGTDNISITSLSAWTITSSESWVTFSQNSGDSGRTTVTATIASHQTSSARTATITVTDGTNVSTIAVSQAKYVSGLPSGTVINYNAKDYVSSTYTIPNYSGASYSGNMIWSATTTTIRNNIVFNTDHLEIPLNAYAGMNFSPAEANIFNITTSQPSMTIVFKAVRDGGGNNFISNRSSGSTRLNWLLRIAENPNRIFLQTASANSSVPSAATYTDKTQPMIVAVIINNRQITIKNITDNVTNTPFTTSWNNAGSFRATWFASRHQSSATTIGEAMSGDYYWTYMTKRVLTDAEIQQVIDYNDSK